MPSQVASVRLEVSGINRLRRAMRALGEKDAPFLRDAVDQISRRTEREVRQRAPGSMAGTVQFAGVRASGVRTYGLIRINHPGAKSMEFGRRQYYFGYKGRAMRSGTKRVVARGQRARPFVGVVNQDAAIGAVAPLARQLWEDAIEREWDRLSALPDTAEAAA